MFFDLEIVDHGEDHAQYFPGCGVSGTRYSHVATGIGVTFGEALDDAIEQMVTNPGDHDEWTEKDLEHIRDWVFRTVTPDDDQTTSDNEWPHNEWWRYVSIRWNNKGNLK